jgi:FKBP-type peptidyl-prolyl cis-trans isomerase 2
MYEQSTAPAWSATRTSRATRAAVIHYTIYLPDGDSISSHETGYPFRFHPSTGEVIPGLEQAVASMQVGETRRIQLSPRQAFGEHHASQVLLARLEHVRAPVELRPGMPVRLSVRDGHTGLRQAFVREMRADGAVFDLNHPLSGLDITMDVTLVAYE